MNQLRNGPTRALESSRRRGPRLRILHPNQDGKNHELPCSRPGCSRKRGRGRTDKLYCSERCRWKARDEEFVRLRRNDFEVLISESACPECKEVLLEAVSKQ
jgi:hypothetical protein